MITTIDIGDLQGESYTIEDIEVIFLSNENYITNEDVYIPLSSLNQLVEKEKEVFIVDLNDKENNLQVSLETLNIIKELLIKKGIIN